MAKKKVITVMGVMSWRREAKEDERLEKMAKGNIDRMDKAVKILPHELLEHPNYENYLLKYGAFMFQLNEKNANNYGKF